MPGFALLQKHDEAGYLKLLQETKNERLLQLVRQTEGYMQQIGSLVVEQREREGISVPTVSSDWQKPLSLTCPLNSLIIISTTK